MHELQLTAKTEYVNVHSEDEISLHSVQMVYIESFSWMESNVTITNVDISWACVKFRTESYKVSLKREKWHARI